MTAATVLCFWFEECTPRHWFVRDAAFDALIRERFAALHGRAAAGECWRWRASPEGRLAEVIVLDQFSRNLYRDDARAFACDGMALVLAQEAVALGADSVLPLPQRGFLYLPYMHSESLVVHDEALRLYTQPGLEAQLEFERRHRALIERFGRYPHRNAVLGRPSTAEELEYLSQPGAGF